MESDLLSSDSFRHAVDSAFNHIILTDIDGKIVYANVCCNKNCWLHQRRNYWPDSKIVRSANA